jgi:hypothetical protein
VKARLEQDTYYNNVRIIAEKVSFIVHLPMKARAENNEIYNYA